MSGKYDKINNYNLSYENLLEAVAEFEGFVVGLSNNDLFLFDDKNALSEEIKSVIATKQEEAANSEIGLDNFIKYVASRILDRTTGTYFFDDMFNGRVQDIYFKHLGEFQSASEQGNIVTAFFKRNAKETYAELTEVEDLLGQYLHIIPPTPHPFTGDKSHNKFVGCVPNVMKHTLISERQVETGTDIIKSEPGPGSMRGAIKYFDSLDLQKMPKFNANNEPVYKEVDGQQIHQEYFSGIAFNKSKHVNPEINESKIGDRFKRPSLASIIMRHPKASLMSRNKSHLPIFFNAVSTLEMSRCTPYIDIRILTQDFASKANTNFGDMSLVKFMRFERKDKDGSFVLDDAGGFGRTTPINNAETPGEISVENQHFNYSYMDIFNSPQTFSNADINGNKDFFGRNNNDPVLEPISPFLTLSSLNVNITGAGFGLMASKRADLSFVLHDRSRLRDLAPLVSSTQFATTKIIIEYGWNHPEGGVGSDNIIGKYLDALKDRSIFQVVGSNFSFGDGNTVKIDVDLAAYGFRQNERVHCGAGPEVPLNMIEDYIEKAANDLVKEAKKEIKSGAISEKEAPQILQTIKLNSRSARATDAMISWAGYETIAQELLTGQKPTKLLEKLTKILLIDTKSENSKSNLAADELSDLKGVIYKELENQSAIARVFGKLEDIRSDLSEDPFEKSTVTGGKFVNVLDDINKQSKTKQTSLGKILSHFVGHPLAATCLYDEVQLMFYPMNHHAGGGRIHTTASFPIPTDILYDKVVERLKSNSHLSVKSFVALIEKIIRDKNLPVYQLADLYTSENNLKSKKMGDKKDILLSKFKNKRLEGLGLDEDNITDEDLFNLLSKENLTDEQFFEKLTKKERNDELDQQLYQLNTLRNETKDAAKQGADPDKKYTISVFTENDTTVPSESREVTQSMASAEHALAIDRINRVNEEKKGANLLYKRYNLLLKTITRDAVSLRKGKVTGRCKELYLNDGLKNSAPAEGKFIRPNIALDYEVVDVIDGPKEYNDKKTEAASEQGPQKDHTSAEGLKTNKQILRVHIYDEESVMDPAKFALLSTLIEGSSAIIGGDSSEKDAKNFNSIDKYVGGLNFNDVKQFVKRAYPTIIYGAANSTIKNVSVQSNTSGDLAQVLMVEAYGNQKNGQVEGFNYENEYESITMFPNTVTLSMMGQPMISRGNNIFIDFGTNTSVDNIYTVKTVSHNLSEGDFSTTVQVVPANMGSISTFKERLADNIAKLNPQK